MNLPPIPPEKIEEGKPWRNWLTSVQQMFFPNDYLTPIDGTADTTDRVLGVEQSKLINVSAATSIPLYVACGDGQEYEISLSRQISTTYTGGTQLNPNNSTYSGSFSDYYSTGGTSGGATAPAFYICYGSSRITSTKVSTSTKTKMHNTYGVGDNGSVNYTFLRSGVWNDTTTAWSSLGTILPGFTWTGRILIRRIA